MKLSGYTTTRNCISMDYPFEQCIESMLAFCDEVVVMDSSDGSDSTRTKLAEMQKINPNKLFVYHAEVDWSAPNHGVYDGALKQAAREKCTGDFLWQMDADEVVVTTKEKIESLIAQLGNLETHHVACLPVVEYWGGKDKIRIDVNPWKWRISKNVPNLTHGIPITHRVMHNGLIYAKPGTDGCDFITKDTGMPVPNLNFYNVNAEHLRQNALMSEEHIEAYQTWLNAVVKTLPTVYHFSWWSIKGKIEKYRDFFGVFWKAMYNDHSRNSNVFFNVPWSEVTEQMIEDKAKELRDNTGGWIFHTPWDGTKTNHVVLESDIPEVMKKWCEERTV